MTATTQEELGPAYTSGPTFRARAEQRAREHRARVLKVGWDRHGHILNAAAVEAGANFITEAAHRAAKNRDRAGKGVGARTFENMLSSQAMCFNIFGPLAEDLPLATSVLATVLPGLQAVTGVQFEFTPPVDIFRDQTGRGGVDCDLLVDAVWQDGERAVVVIETKFVETEFSVCGFTKPTASAQCDVGTVPVRGDSQACLYASRKGYLYWDRTRELGNINLQALPDAGCPFAGPYWQLWVNHTLAHALATRSRAKHAVFAVCAAAQNEALLKSGAVLDGFKSLVKDPDTVRFVSLDALLAAIQGHAPPGNAWATGLCQRYMNI